MPESVEIPAPVSTVIRSASAIHPRAAATSSSVSIAPVCPAGAGTEPPERPSRFPFPTRGDPLGRYGSPIDPIASPTHQEAPVSFVPFELEPLPLRVRVRPWDDPLVDRRGHDPRSVYVEQFWLSVLGPTATWLLRRLVAGFDHHPDGYELDVAERGALARALGHEGVGLPVRQGAPALRDVRCGAAAAGRVGRATTRPADLAAPPAAIARRAAVGAPAVDHDHDQPRLAGPGPRAGRGDAGRR